MILKWIQKYLFILLGAFGIITQPISFFLNDSHKLVKFFKEHCVIILWISIPLLTIGILIFFIDIVLKVKGVRGEPIKFKYIIRRANPFLINNYLHLIHEFQHKFNEYSNEIYLHKIASPDNNYEKKKISELLIICQKLLYNLTGVDFSIHIKLFENKRKNTGSEINVYDSLLETYIRVQSEAEKSICPERSSDEKFSISEFPRNYDESTFYSTIAKEVKDGKKKNFAYDYVFGHTQHYWLSNNLEIDEKNKLFVSSSDNWRTYYKSLGVFIISSPLHKGNNDNINGNCIGLLVVDSHLTNVFQENLTKEVMGYFSHRFYDYFTFYIKNNNNLASQNDNSNPSPILEDGNEQKHNKAVTIKRIK